MHTDREAEAVDRRVVGHGSQAVDRVGRDVHQIALGDLAVLVLDRHDARDRRSRNRTRASGASAGRRARYLRPRTR